jgi:hypothetical protein
LEDWVAEIAGSAEGTVETGERLQKVLAKSGLGSRRTCELLIVEV